MRLEELKRRVERSERLVQGRTEQAVQARAELTRQWHEAWTPLRIVVAGLATGFIAGRARPGRALRQLGKLGGPRSLQMIGSLTRLASSVQTAIAAFAATAAAATAASPADTEPDASAQTAETVTETTAGTAAEAAPVEPPQSVPQDTPADDSPDVPRPSPDRRRPDPQWNSQPAPAEAATDLSER